MRSMSVRRRLYRAARVGLRGAPPQVREVALALAARARAGPALLPGPPPGPVLVLAPHPDDETIGCGGTLARHAACGDQVTVLVATSGEATTGGAGAVADVREAECRAACADLGVGEPVFLRLTDGDLAADGAALTEAIAEHGSRVAVVYAPNLLDPHPDHHAANAALARAGLTAEIYGYEVWSPAACDVLIDVSDVFERKERALARYATALDSVDYRRVARGLAAYRSAAGGLGGRGYAEAFVRMDPATHRDLARRLG